MELFFYKYVIKISAVLFTSCMLSGFTWNRMKNPSMFRNHEGIITYIYPYQNAQYIYESYIISMLYTMLVFGFLLLNKSNTIKSYTILCRIIAISSLALQMYLFDVLLSIFKSKSNGYPYSLTGLFMWIYDSVSNILQF